MIETIILIFFITCLFVLGSILYEIINITSDWIIYKNDINYNFKCEYITFNQLKLITDDANCKYSTFSKDVLEFSKESKGVKKYIHCSKYYIQYHTNSMIYDYKYLVIKNFTDYLKFINFLNKKKKILRSKYRDSKNKIIYFNENDF